MTTNNETNNKAAAKVTTVSNPYTFKIENNTNFKSLTIIEDYTWITMSVGYYEYNGTASKGYMPAYSRGSISPNNINGITIKGLSVTYSRNPYTSLTLSTKPANEIIIKGYNGATLTVPYSMAWNGTYIYQNGDNVDFIGLFGGGSTIKFTLLW